MDSKKNKPGNEQEKQWITLKLPVPVYIVYFTAWVDKEGNLNFRNDIYGHDSRMKKRLFE